MNQKARMLKGLPYKAWLDGLAEERLENKVRLYEYNHCHPQEREKQNMLIRRILGKAGEHVQIEGPFHCDYGYNIEVGNNFFANYNLTILDVARVTIGENVFCGPNVTIITAGHPIHPVPRNAGYEYGIEVKIGKNVWLGSNVVINPGVTIGNNAVIGSGAIVVKDIPDNVIAVGNPCKVLRAITDEDIHYFYKDRPFDVSDFNGVL